MTRDYDEATPVISQYLKIKQEHPDSVLFFRMGDFFELFFEDAVIAADILGITLTKRGKFKDQDIPMCGVPVNKYEKYLHDLVRGGLKVALCDQTETSEDARKRGAKSVVKREVVRIITTGTLTEESLLSGNKANYLSACLIRGNTFSFAWVELSTGESRVISADLKRFDEIFLRINPSEFIIRNSLEIPDDIWSFIKELGTVITFVSDSSFNAERAKKRLEDVYKIIDFQIFADFTQDEYSVMGAVYDYVEITQKNAYVMLQQPICENLDKSVQFDYNTWESLEVTKTNRGTYKGSLQSFLDHTMTSCGARLLGQWISQPVTDINIIRRRADCVEYFYQEHEKRTLLRKIIYKMPDAERIISRIVMGRSNPRDLYNLGKTLEQATEVWRFLLLYKSEAVISVPDVIIGFIDGWNDFTALIHEISISLVEAPPYIIKNGDFIASGYSHALDEIRKIRDDSQSILMKMQRKYQDETGINNLKIKNNNVLGYFIEVTESQSENMFSDNLITKFVHRQSLKGAVRFTTAELSDLEIEIGRSFSQAISIEIEIFEKICEMVISMQDNIRQCFALISELDVILSFSHIANAKMWVRPEVDDSLALEVVGGWHPIVHDTLMHEKGAGSFIVNDCIIHTDMHHQSLWLITGPNMAGKSTFLRQNAIIIILAQIGCFVPASKARIGVVNQIFSRVGASDDLARGRSTFMVEMIETATILNRANERAFVIFDEIGRGTSTYDGLSIAWAVVEYLHNVNKCRTLFATHYHELGYAANKLHNIRNMTVKIKEWHDDIVLLHKIEDGVARGSYGIKVARLAGLPIDVVQRAQELLYAFEGEHINALSDTLKKFIDSPECLDVNKTSAHRAIGELSHREYSWCSAMQEYMSQINPDNMSPKEALDALYNIHNIMEH